MKKALLLALLTLLIYSAYSQKKVVVMGSSTAAGTGANPSDSSWVNRLQQYFRRNTTDGIDTTVYNIAWYGQTTYTQMPTGFVSPIANRDPVDPTTNVTKAISFNPDVVIINLPSNDVANYYWGAGTYATVETMNNFRTMVTYLTNNSTANVFVTTSQPRNDMNYIPEKKVLLRQLVDSINATFGNRAIDFWTPLASPDSLLRADLKADDIHPNNTGHRLLFQQVIAKNLFATNGPLPVILTDFNGALRNTSVVLTWKADDEEQTTRYTVERSSNGRDFTTLTTLAAQGVTSATYQYTDAQPLQPRGFYRIHVTEAGRSFYSPVISVGIKGNPLTIESVVAQGSNLNIRLQSVGTGAVTIHLFTLDGRLVQKQSRAYAPSISLPTPGLPGGTYLLRIEQDGHSAQLKWQKLP